jgi:hypothetical protein
MNKTYGLGYRGSKSGIAPWVLDKLPAGDTFVDLFAGGCAITHAAILSGKYKHIICNDITDAPILFRDAMQGKYRGENRWISREDFFALKDTEPIVRLCFSFSCDQKTYMYGKDIEELMEAEHRALFYGETAPLRKFGIVIPQAFLLSNNVIGAIS